MTGLRLLVGAIAAAAPAEDPPRSSAVAASARVLPAGEEVRSAIEDGLQFLALRQRWQSGSIGSDFRVGTTSLAGLAFLGAGNGYGRGRYGEAVGRCVQFIVDRASTEIGGGPHGYVGDGPGEGKASRMHGHGFAILFLTQVFGELPPSRSKDVARAIRNGIRVIEMAASSRGGWWYDPDNDEDRDESSVTVCVLQALRAAHNIGFEVDPEVIRRAELYLRRCANPDGSFQYSLSMGARRSSFELTAAAVSSLHAVGIYRTEEVRRGLAYLRKKWARLADRPLEAAGTYRFYGNLYAAQAFFQAGGAYWEGWYPNARRQLLGERVSDPAAGPGGRLPHWRNSRYGDEYATAVALLIIEIPLRYLPIFQR